MEGLGFSLPTLFAQIVNFVILFGLLYLVAYKPIMRMLDERSKRVKESMDQTESIKEQAAHADEEAKKQIEAASKEGQELVAQAVRTGEEVRQKAQQPLCVGFGISTPEQARRDSQVANGVIVGSHLIQLIEEDATLSSLKDFVLSLRGALS